MSVTAALKPQSAALAPFIFLWPNDPSRPLVLSFIWAPCMFYWKSLNSCGLVHIKCPVITFIQAAVRFMISAGLELLHVWFALWGVLFARRLLVQHQYLNRKQCQSAALSVFHILFLGFFWSMLYYLTRRDPVKPRCSSCCVKYL